VIKTVPEQRTGLPKKSKLKENPKPPNDPSSATAATRRVDWNSSAMPPFAAAHG